MSSDTETFTKRQTKKNRRRADAGDDFPAMMTDMFGGINWKISFFLFVLMVFIFSDIYIELFLNSIDGAVIGDCPTTKGTMIQITATVICYIILDLLVQGGFL